MRAPGLTRSLPRQLHIQVGFIVSLLLIATIASYAGYTARVQTTRFLSAVTTQTAVIAKNFASVSTNYLLVEDYASLEMFLLKLAELPNIMSMALCDGNGKVLNYVVHEEGAAPHPVFNTGPLTPPGEIGPHLAVLKDRIIAWHPVHAGMLLGWVRVDLSLRALREMQKTIWRHTVIAGVPAVTAGVFLIMLFLNRHIRAVRRITAFAKRLNEERGSTIPVETSSAEIEDLISALNETSVKLLEQEHSISESERNLERLRHHILLIFQSVGEGILGLDLAGRHTFANPAAGRLLGYEEGELIGLACTETWYRLDSRGLPRRGGECPMAVVIEQEAGQYVDHDVFWRKDGTFFPVEYTTTPIREGGRVTGAVITFRDVTTRKQSEDALKESERKYRTLFEDSKDGIVIAALDGTIMDINQAGVELMGYSTKDDLRAVNMVRDLFATPADSGVVQHALEKQGFIKDHELMLRRMDGELITVLMTATAVRDGRGAVTAFRGILRDVTAEQRLELQLRHAQKMEAVGQLTGGIAHDFNNILTAIIGFGHLLLMKQKDDDPLRPYAEQILTSAERATHLTQSLLAFSRKQIFMPKPVNVNSLVERVSKLLVKLTGEDVEHDLSLADEPLTIKVDSGQIEQVLMNLAANARDAMPAGGTLTIEINKVELDNAFIIAHGYGVTGRYARITVSDTGMGMDEITAKKIFEPFFTTKEVGKGTGLGLSIVYGIIKQHRGFINCYSEPGHGTTFKIYLPLIAAPAEETRPQELVPYRGGTETLLLAEDDPEVRRLAREVLIEFGYSLIEASDGEEAVNKFTENGDRVALLILDVIMPKRNGREVYELIRKLKPDVKALFMSGYTANIIHQRGILEEGLNFIPKPVSPSELLKKVRELLDEK